MEDLEDNLTAKDCTEQNKFQRFKNFFKDDARDWYKLNIEKVTTPLTNWNELKSRFLDYHSPKDKQTYARHRLLSYKQANGQIFRNISRKRSCYVLIITHLCRRTKEYSLLLKGCYHKGRMQKENNTLVSLRDNADKVERGIRVIGKQNEVMCSDIRRRLENNEINILQLSNDLSKVLEKFDQMDRNLEELQQESYYSDSSDK